MPDESFTMRRADRLFHIIQILRRTSKPVTARAMAEELEVTERTIYRDVAALQSRRVPVEGEAGVGYLLRSGFDLPPMMFSEDELEALLLGARIVQCWADPGLATAAADVLGKIEAVLPKGLQPLLTTRSLGAPESVRKPVVHVDMAIVRRCIRDKRRLQIDYTDEQGRETTRTIWPLCLTFWGVVWMVAGWCEMREDFRAFRPDRIKEIRALGERFPDTPGRTLTDFLKQQGVV